MVLPGGKSEVLKSFGVGASFIVTFEARTASGALGGFFGASDGLRVAIASSERLTAALIASASRAPGRSSEERVVARASFKIEEAGSTGLFDAAVFVSRVVRAGAVCGDSIADSKICDSDKATGKTRSTTSSADVDAVSRFENESSRVGISLGSGSGVSRSDDSTGDGAWSVRASPRAASSWVFSASLLSVALTFTPSSRNSRIASKRWNGAVCMALSSFGEMGFDVAVGAELELSGMDETFDDGAVRCEVSGTASLTGAVLEGANSVSCVFVDAENASLSWSVSASVSSQTGASSREVAF
jgi:hypothetical protein